MMGHSPGCGRGRLVEVALEKEPKAVNRTAPSPAPQRLLGDGFCVVPGMLTREQLEGLRAASDAVLDTMRDEERKRTGNQGHVVQMKYQDPMFVRLIALPATLAALADLGFAAPRYWSGYVVCKEPHTAAPSYWHQDWPFWDEPISADRDPSQLFLMYYLSDTTVANGCLRVIPQTHVRRLPLHAQIGAAHDDDTRFQDPSSSPAYADHPDQVDIEVHAGDLIIGDARLLHSAYGNTTSSRRTNLVLWYLPRYDQMPASLKAAVQSRLYVPPPPSLPADARALIEPLLPDYQGQAAPSRWNRVPGQHLRA